MTFLRPAGVLVLLCAALPALAQDLARGRLLYETYCGECHYERVHERSPEKSRIHNLSDLRDMVANRARLTKFQFSLDDIENVVAYLNRSHYNLKK